MNSVVPGQGTKHGCCSSCSLSFLTRSPHFSSSTALEGYGLSGQSDQCTTHVRFLSLVPSPHSAPCTKAHGWLINLDERWPVKQRSLLQWHLSANDWHWEWNSISAFLMNCVTWSHSWCFNDKRTLSMFLSCLHFPQDAVRAGDWKPTHGKYEYNNISYVCNDTYESGFCTERCNEFDNTNNADHSSYSDRSKRVSSFHGYISYTLLLQTWTSTVHADIFHPVFFKWNTCAIRTLRLIMNAENSKNLQKKNVPLFFLVNWCVICSEIVQRAIVIML